MENEYTRYKYIVINSKDKTDYSLSNSNFNTRFAYDIPLKYCKLLYCCIPNTFYNITNRNNGIDINTEITYIEPGSYSLYELIDEIKSELPIFSDITYNSITQKLEFTSSNSITLSFPETNSIASVLGFPNNYTNTGTSFISSQPPNLTNNNIYIEVQELKNNYMNTNNIYRNQTFVIPVVSNKEDYIIYNSENDFPQYVECFTQAEHIYNLHIRLKDYDGYDLINVAHWSMILIFRW